MSRAEKWKLYRDLRKKDFGSLSKKEKKFSETFWEDADSPTCGDPYCISPSGNEN